MAYSALVGKGAQGNFKVFSLKAEASSYNRIQFRRVRTTLEEALKVTQFQITRSMMQGSRTTDTEYYSSSMAQVQKVIQDVFFLGH